jgi:hypothetical protein
VTPMQISTAMGYAVLELRRLRTAT